MKQKKITVKPTKISKERISNEDQAGIDESEMEVGEGSVNGEIEDDLGVSATDSDEDKSDVDSDAHGYSELTQDKKSKIEQIKESIMQRYHKRQGKQLYIRFPHKVPETQEALEEKVRELTSLVVKVRKPRQRHSRFCLVDFATKDDRDSALNDLKKSIKKGDLNKYVVNTPRTESAEFVQNLVERKIKSIENNQVKLRLKKASKKSLKEKNYTSTVIVLNLPRNASILQIRKLFANAVDVNVRPSRGNFKDKSIAAITFPTTFDATNAIKKKLFLEGNELSIKFDNKRFKQNANEESKKKSEICESIQETTPIIKKQKLESTIQKIKGKKSSCSVRHKQNLNKNEKFKKDLSKGSKQISENCESIQATEPIIKKQKIVTQNLKGKKSSCSVHKQILNTNKKFKKDARKDCKEIFENFESSQVTKPFIKKRKLESTIIQHVKEKKSNISIHKPNLNRSKAKKNNAISNPK